MLLRPLRVLAVPVAFVIVSVLASCASHSPTTAAAPGATYKGRGIVVAVDAEKARIKINHEKIEGFMDAMTMWFDVKDASLLTGIAPSDKVEFTIVEEASADMITELRKSPA